MGTAIVATDFGGPEVLSVVDHEVPEPQAGEVKIRVKAAATNPIDYKLYSGAFGTDRSQLPKPLGLEISGVVTATGEDAEGPAGRLGVGDEVIAQPVSGGYASEVTVSAAKVVPKPPELGWEQAAGVLLTGGTAVHTLHATGVGDGTTVLIHGVAGGVGLTAAQLAIARGATVIGTAAEHRHANLREYGIHPVTYGEGLADRVRQAAPDGVDAAIDTVGTDEAVDVSLELVADRQRIATIAAFERGGEAGIKILGGAPGAERGAEIRANAWTELLALAAQGKLDVVVAKTYPLSDAAEAHRFLADGHAGGKVVLVP
jgi:NADPH2:quinone reductase